MNCNDYQCGWDIDYFGMNVLELVLVYYEILMVGGFMFGGINFDVKLCCQFLDLVDLIQVYVGLVDVIVCGLKVVVEMIEDGCFKGFVDDCYVGWKLLENQDILNGGSFLEVLVECVYLKDFELQLVFGKQEYLESLVNLFV